tara:strand:+ start:12555 stop:13214 length:660 start_codon:yes stop_codon:yes gene_type:complete
MSDYAKRTLILSTQRLLNPSKDDVHNHSEIQDMQQSLLELAKRKRQIEIERMALHRKEEFDIDRQARAINKKMEAKWNKARLSKFYGGQTVIARQRGEAARGGPDCPMHEGFIANGEGVREGVKGRVLRTVCGPRNQGVWVQFPKESGMACRPFDCFFYRLDSIECSKALEPAESGWEGYLLATLTDIRSLAHQIVPKPASWFGAVLKNEMEVEDFMKS